MSDKIPIVFVVDDDKAVRKSLARLIKSVGLTVEAFSSAREFLERDPSDGPSCLVLDVRMPGLSGLDLQKELGKMGYTIGNDLHFISLPRPFSGFSSNSMISDVKPKP
jgi:FixJ family two-component response regulator